MELYPVDFCMLSGVSDSTYRRAFNELLDKGYLVQSDKNKNLYLFREVSEGENIKIPDKINSIDKESFEKIKEEYFN